LETSPKKYSGKELEDLTRFSLQKRGVQLDDIAILVYELQKDYIDDLNHQKCLQSVESVLKKREVQNAVFTGICLDELGEKDLLPSPLLDMLKKDDGLYGIDEVLALSITNIYGTIGLTNFGYLDKIKIGIIAEINRKKRETVNTFLDDLVAAIAAAAAARLAHQQRDGEED